MARPNPLDLTLCPIANLVEFPLIIVPRLRYYVPGPGTASNRQTSISVMPTGPIKIPLKAAFSALFKSKSASYAYKLELESRVCECGRTDSRRGSSTWHGKAGTVNLGESECVVFSTMAESVLQLSQPTTRIQSSSKVRTGRQPDIVPALTRPARRSRVQLVHVLGVGVNLRAESTVRGTAISCRTGCSLRSCHPPGSRADYSSHLWPCLRESSVRVGC